MKPGCPGAGRDQDKWQKGSKACGGGGGGGGTNRLQQRNGMEWNVPQLPHSHSHTAIAMAMSGTSVWHRDTAAWDSGIGTWGAW